MTYCLGILLSDGLVLIADTRTNAGVDNVSSYRKLHSLVYEPEREIYAATSGNLSASQAALSLLEEGVPGGDGPRTLHEVTSMFRAAQLVGEAVRIANAAVRQSIGPSRSGSCMLVGGRVGAGPPRLFLVYEEGNCIECRRDVPFLQIGETKYGRPILDRVIHWAMPLPGAVKIGLLSFDSAIRSNLSVSRPLDLVAMPKDPRAATLSRRIEKDDVYFNELSGNWSALLYQATLSIPDPDFMTEFAEPRSLGIVSEMRR